MTPDSPLSSPVDSPADPVVKDGSARDALLPVVLRRIGRLEVRAQRVVEGFLSGRHESPYIGQSLEFREHREYAPGDELRHVDWKVWGRQDRLYVKQYEEETNLRATLLVDSSASMAYRSAAMPEGMTKHEYAATAACALAYLFVRQHDAVGCLTFAEGIVTSTPSRNRRAHVATIAAALTTPTSGAKTGLGTALTQAASTTPQRGITVLFSDLLCDPKELRRGLASLRARGADMVVLQVLDDDELDFPFEGPTQFVGLEGPITLDANPRALRKEYLAALERHQAAIRAACAAERADYRLIRTSEPLDTALMALLSSRRKRGIGF